MADLMRSVLATMRSMRRPAAPEPESARGRSRRLGATLLHQQCWCWGQDVKRRCGNLLLAYGLERVRPPNGVDASSRYQLRLDARRFITLWGFGAVATDLTRGTLYLNRFEFRPTLLANRIVDRPIHAPSELPSGRLPASRSELDSASRLAVQFCQFVSAYESWVAESLGLEYRRASLAGFSGLKIAAESITTSWNTLAKRLSRGQF